MYEKDVAHIVYASDDKFAEILGVSLVSLLENSKDLKDILIYILDSGISDDNKEKIEAVCNKYNRHSPIWLQAKDISKELGLEVTSDRGSLSQYARLFVSSALPEDLGRVLYLDCDIIVNKSIKELWNLNLEGKTIAALLDAFSRLYRSNIGLKPEEVMFNSGVMLIDLKLWREQSIEKRLLKFISDNKGKIQQGDQGALNAILSKDTYCFEPRFNSVTIFYDFTYKDMMTYRKPPEFYTQDEIRRAKEDPTIIHFTTSFLSKRPWVEGCEHMYVKKWIEYKELSPWKDKPLWKDNRAQWKKKAVFIYKLMPKWLSVRIAGILQAYVRPIYIKLAYKKLSFN